MRAVYGYPAFGGRVYSGGAAELTAKEETDMLREQADFLKQQLQDIQNRISALEPTQTQKDK